MKRAAVRKDQKKARSISFITLYTLHGYMSFWTVQTTKTRLYETIPTTKIHKLGIAEIGK